MEILGLAIWQIVLIALALLVIYLAFVWYRVVPPSEAHFVTSSGKIMVVSPDTNVQQNANAAYFAIPEFVPRFGRKIRILSVTIKEINGDMETFEKDQARYLVRYSVKYRITNVMKAAQTFINEQELFKQADDQVRSAVRAVTIKYSVNDARAFKQKMADEVKTELADDFEKWGLSLVMFALVDFQDTKDSFVISNISKRREVEIETDTRQQNAEKYKNAKMKEAEADELAKKREIERDQVVAQREQEKIKLVAEKEKEAREQQLEVTRVQQVKTQQIEKEKQIVLANQQKEVEEINKQQKRLIGEGDKLKLEEQAKGNAAKFREDGLAEAAGKQALQAALNKFEDKAIRALVAELVVNANKEVGLKAAEALTKADMKIFVGDKNAQGSFDWGQMVSALMVSNEGLATSFLNKVARPNDLGFTPFLTPVEKTESKPEKANA